MAEIVRPARFQQPVTVGVDLSSGPDQTAVVFVTAKDWASLDGLKPVEPGIEIVGVLEGEDAALYLELHRSHLELDALSRSKLSDSMEQQARRLREGAQIGDIQAGQHCFIDDADMEAYYALAQRHVALYHRFHYRLGERFGRHAYRLGVRAGGKVVVVGPRWTLQPGAQ